MDYIRIPDQGSRTLIQAPVAVLRVVAVGLSFERVHSASPFPNDGCDRWLQNLAT